MAWRKASSLRGTTALIAVSVVVFFLDLRSGHSILMWGAISPDVWAGQWQRLIAPNFIHSGMTHLLFNMYALYIFGRIVEGMIGAAKFLGVFFISGLVGFCVSLLATPGTLAVGASAALFGLMGYTLHFRIRRLPLTRLPIDTAFFQIFAINLFVAFIVPNIDHYAHIGGLIGGILAGGLVGLPMLSRGFTLDGVEIPHESRSFLLTEKVISSFLLITLVAFSLAPLQFARTFGSDSFEKAVDARYGSFFMPFRAVNGTIFWFDSEKPEEDWKPARTTIERGPSGEVALGFYWRWSRGAARSGSAPATYEVHWMRMLFGGEWETVHIDRGQVNTPDTRPGLIYRRAMLVEPNAGDFDGDWQVLLYVDGIEQLKEGFAIKTRRRRI